MYLWLKAFHVVFMVTWFAGLFYLPRLFVYHCEVADTEGRARFETMERRLMMITHIGAGLTVLAGVALIGVAYRGPLPGWLSFKLILVALLIAFHISCWVYVRRFARRESHPSARFFRLYNEVPAVLLIGIVLLAVLKPA